MKIKNMFYLVIFAFLCIISQASADVTDIDADVIANVVFGNDIGGDPTTTSITINWTADYSGYLYVFAHDDIAVPSDSGIINDMTGTPEVFDIGVMDDGAEYDFPQRGWRLGYVTNGTTYIIGGRIYEPGSDICGALGAYYVELDELSYSGGYTGHVFGPTPGAWSECSGYNTGPGALPFLLIEAPPPTSTLSGYVTDDVYGNPINSASISLNNSGGSTTSNVSGFYSISDITADTYSITASAALYENYFDIVSISSDTTKNISMTLDTTEEIIIPPIVAPPPISTTIPNPTETPPVDEEDEEDEDNEDLIDIIVEIIDDLIIQSIENVIEFFDETIIEPTKVIVEEFIIHVSSTFNWILLTFVYLSTFAGRIIKGGRDVLELTVDTALYGTLATMAILFLSFIGFSIIFSNELIAVVIFVVVGFGFGILPEIINNRSVQE